MCGYKTIDKEVMSLQSLSLRKVALPVPSPEGWAGGWGAGSWLGVGDSGSQEPPRLGEPAWLCLLSTYCGLPVGGHRALAHTVTLPCIPMCPVLPSPACLSPAPRWWC